MKNSGDGDGADDVPKVAIPTASVPLMTELIFSHSTENPNLDAPDKNEMESPLLKCASCSVCVHACKYQSVFLLSLMFFFVPWNKT